MGGTILLHLVSWDVHTLDRVRSQIQTARRWLPELEDGRVTEAATTVALEESDDGASSVAASFAALDPPGGTMAIHDAVTAAASSARAQLTRLRIAAHADDWSGALSAQGCRPRSPPTVRTSARRRAGDSSTIQSQIRSPS